VSQNIKHYDGSLVKKIFIEIVIKMKNRIYEFDQLKNQ